MTPAGRPPHRATTASAWDPAKPDLVTIRIHVGDLASSVRVRLLLRRLQSPLGYLGHPAVEVVNDDGVPGVAGMFRQLDDVHRPVLSEFPHRLGVVGEERRRGLEPAQRETYPNGVRKITYVDPDGNETGFGGVPG